MPPRDIPQDADNSGAGKDCTAWDSELLKGVLISSGIAAVFFVILCEALARRYKEKRKRIHAEEQIEHLAGIIALHESTIALYVNHWGYLPRHIIDEEERNPGRHTDPGVPVASRSQPLRPHHGVSDRNFDRLVSADNGRETGNYMSGANGGATSDRFRPRPVSDNTGPEGRTLPDEPRPHTFVVSIPDDVSDAYSVDGNPGSSRHDGHRNEQVSPISSNASVRSDNDLSASVSSGRSLTHGPRDAVREQRL